MKNLLFSICFFFLMQISMAQTPSYQWTRSFGASASDEEGRSVALDASGNVYITGAFRGTVDFDPGPGTNNLVSGGQEDIYILKLDPSGNFVWAKRMGGTNKDFSVSIAIDGLGNVYTTGTFEGTADFDPGPNISNLGPAAGNYHDMFISKLDATGNFVWAKRIAGSQLMTPTAITVDATGNSITTGSFPGSADFDPGAGTFSLISAGGADIFIEKLDPSGNFIWAGQFAGPDSDLGTSITTDGTGNIYTTGYFDKTVDFDPGPGTNNMTAAGNGGNEDIFISKLNPSGTFIWAKRIGALAGQRGLDISVDASGNVYYVGYFDGPVDFDPGPGTDNKNPIGYNDICVAKLNATGNYVWAKQLGGTTIDRGRSIALDITGNVYITGDFSGTGDFDPGAATSTITSSGQEDIFITKLDSSGNFQWAKGMGGASREFGYGIAVDGSGNVYTTGSFEGTVDFNPDGGLDNLTSMGYIDMFIQKIGQTGFAIPELESPDLFFYPNPCKTFFCVEFSINSEVSVINMLGEVIIEQNIKPGKVSFDMTNQPNGIYFVRVTSEGRQQLGKLIKQ